MFRGVGIMVRGLCALKPSAPAVCTPSSPRSLTTTPTRSEWSPSPMQRWVRSRALNSRGVLGRAPRNSTRSTPSSRHHGKVAVELQERTDLMGEGRPLPPRSGTVGIAGSQPKEDAHGTLYRVGCAYSELHPGGSERGREASETRGSGDQRSGAEASASVDSGTEARRVCRAPGCTSCYAARRRMSW